MQIGRTKLESDSGLKPWLSSPPFRSHESERETQAEQLWWRRCPRGPSPACTLTHPRVSAPLSSGHTVVPLDGDRSKHDGHPDQRQNTTAPELFPNFDSIGSGDYDKRLWLVGHLPGARRHGRRWIRPQQHPRAVLGAINTDERRPQPQIQRWW
jgi:hypothetical protein